MARKEARSLGTNNRNSRLFLIGYPVPLRRYGLFGIDEGTLKRARLEFPARAMIKGGEGRRTRIPNIRNAREGGTPAACALIVNAARGLGH